MKTTASSLTVRTWAGARLAIPVIVLFFTSSDGPGTQSRQVEYCAYYSEGMKKKKK